MFCWPYFRWKKNTVHPNAVGDESGVHRSTCVNILTDSRETSAVADTLATSISSALTETGRKQEAKRPWWRFSFAPAKRKKVVEPTSPKEEQVKEQVKEETSTGQAGHPSCVKVADPNKASSSHKAPETSYSGGVRAVPFVDRAGVEVPGSQILDGGLDRCPTQAATPSFTEQHFVCLGFPNLVQTCYMNAVLQSLQTLKSFNQVINRQHKVWSSVPAAKLIRRFVAIGASHYSNNIGYKRTALRSFKRTVAAQAPAFRDNTQKDAHEFLSCVLHQLKSLSPLLRRVAQKIGSNYTCPVEAHLDFIMQSNRICKGCGLQSSKQEDFDNLSLDLVPGGSVSQCLQHYLAETELAFHCQCGAQTSSRRWSFLTLPSVLVLHLKRVRLSPTCTPEKVKDPVILSRELEVVSGPSTGGLHSHNQEKCKYTLVSVLSHMGSTVNSGHYKSYGAYPEDEPGHQTDRWLCYDDLLVTETTGTSVCRQQQAAAYILFYERQLRGRKAHIQH